MYIYTYIYMYVYVLDCVQMCTCMMYNSIHAHACMHADIHIYRGECFFISLPLSFSPFLPDMRLMLAWRGGSLHLWELTIKSDSGIIINLHALIFDFIHVYYFLVFETMHTNIIIHY